MKSQPKIERRVRSVINHRFWKISVAGFLFVVTTVSAAENVIVTDVDGVKSTGGLKSWLEGSIAVESASPQEISVKNIRSIAFERSARQLTSGHPVIWLANGDRICARAVKISNDLLTVSWPVLEAADSLVIPLEKVVAVIFELPATLPEQLRLFADIETLPLGNDVVVLSNGDRSLGEIERLDASFVELKGAKSSLSLDRSRVLAIRMNPELTVVKRSSGRRAILTLTDGSELTATRIQLVDDALHVKSSSFGNLKLPLDAVALCEFYGDRIVPITDYELSKVEFTPYLSNIWPVVRNANVLHGPLRLRGVQYHTGLGVHSRVTATYELRGNERLFQSFVGIDDAANGAGSAVFAVELDGRRIWTSKEITGKSAIERAPDINVRGGKRLTLLVDFGQFADVSDYADWCDAVLILEQAP